MDWASSAKEFATWLFSGVGLAAMVPFFTQVIKKYLKWDGEKAFALSAAVSFALSLLGFFVVKYGWYMYLEEYWPLLVAWVVAVFGGSQLFYRFSPTKDKGSGS